MLVGRVEGRVVGDEYHIRQGGRVLKVIPLAEARLDERLAATIKRNGWGPAL